MKHLVSTVSVQKAKRLDRLRHTEWNMLFNSITRDKSYLALHSLYLIYMIYHISPPSIDSTGVA